jgi:hypothetical protein
MKIPCGVQVVGGSLSIELVSWSKEVIWLDKAHTYGFSGVPEDIWNFHIGGYQVCEKWLKDRKGRTLSKDDIAHYQKIVAAISETIRIMGEIDKVIDAHGGWPEAFVTTPQAPALPAIEKADSVPGFHLKHQEASPPAGLFSRPVPWSKISPESVISSPAPDKSNADSKPGHTRSESPLIEDMEEIDLLSAIRTVYGKFEHLDRESLAKEISRELGFERLGPKIAAAIEEAINIASKRKIIRSDRGGFVLQCRTISDYTRDELVDFLAATMRGHTGPSLWDRDEAIRLAARHLGFRRTGPQIVEEFRSAINAGIRRGILEREGAQIRLCGAS